MASEYARDVAIGILETVARMAFFLCDGSLRICLEFDGCVEDGIEFIFCSR